MMELQNEICSDGDTGDDGDSEVILELMKSVMQPVCLTATASWIKMIRIFCAGKESCANKIKRKTHSVV